MSSHSFKNKVNYNLFTYIGLTFFSVSVGKNSVNSVIGGIGMLLGPRALKSLNSIEKNTTDNGVCLI